jgi:hypothetical protein
MNVELHLINVLFHRFIGSCPYKLTISLSLNSLPQLKITMYAIRPLKYVATCCLFFIGFASYSAGVNSADSDKLKLEKKLKEIELVQQLIVTTSDDSVHLIADLHYLSRDQFLIKTLHEWYNIRMRMQHPPITPDHHRIIQIQEVEKHLVKNMQLYLSEAKKVIQKQLSELK